MLLKVGLILTHFGFCFTTFTTIGKCLALSRGRSIHVLSTTAGYGSPYAPVTDGGRAFFIPWSMCGVASMTVLLSLLADGFTFSFGE